MQNEVLKHGDTEKKILTSFSRFGSFINFLSWFRVHGKIVGEFRVVIKLFFWKGLQSSGWSKQFCSSGGSQPDLSWFSPFSKVMSMAEKILSQLKWRSCQKINLWALTTTYNASLSYMCGLIQHHNYGLHTVYSVLASLRSYLILVQHEDCAPEFRACLK